MYELEELSEMMQAKSQIREKYRNIEHDMIDKLNE